MTEFRTSAEWLTYHQKGLAAALRKSQEDTEAAYRRQHPEAAGLLIKSDIFVYPKRPKGFASYPVDVVGWFLEVPRTLRETNKATVERLQARYGAAYKVPANVLTRKLHAGTLKRIEKLLATHGKQVDLTANDTVSKIRRALRAKAVSAQAGTVYEVPVSFSEDTVVIGETPFPVQTHTKGYRRIRVGRNWVRCDVLEALFKRAVSMDLPTK